MRPYVIQCNAVSVDGRTTGFGLDLGLYYDLVSDMACDLHLTGADTLLAGDPSLADVPVSPKRIPWADDDRSPLAVVDSRGRLRSWRTLQEAGYWRGGIALCAESTPAAHIDLLASQGVEALVAGRERVDLPTALGMLHARYGSKRVLVDSGGALSGALHRQGLIDEVALLVVPTLAGGDPPKLLCAEVAPVPLELLSARAVDDGGVWLHYRVMR